MHIQIVDHKNSSRLQTFCDGADRIIMFTTGFEVSETRKEIKSIVKIISPEWKPHIMYKKIKIGSFKLFCIFDIIKRNIDPGYCVTHRSKYFAVATFTTC